MLNLHFILDKYSQLIKYKRDQYNQCVLIQNANVENGI